MTFKVYRWDDAEAPVLDTSKGSLVNLLEKVLVTGYGASPQETTPPDTPWNIDKSSDGQHAVLWSGSAAATGHYFYVRDDGEVEDPVTGSTLEHGREAYIKGALDFTGWDADGLPVLSDVFPKEDLMPHGSVIEKRDSTTRTSVNAWLVVADEKCVYLIVGGYQTDNEQWNSPSGVQHYGVRMFGDVRMITPDIPASAVIAGSLYNAGSTPVRYTPITVNTASNTEGMALSYDHLSGGAGEGLRRAPAYSYLVDQVSNTGAPWADSIPSLGGGDLSEDAFLLCSTSTRHPVRVELIGLREMRIVIHDNTAQHTHFWESLVGVPLNVDPLIVRIGEGGTDRLVVCNSGASWFDLGFSLFDLGDDL